MLRQVAQLLTAGHGQHENQFLLNPSNQLEVLDGFAHLCDLRREYHEVYTQLQTAQTALAQLATSSSLRQQQLELHRFQAAEIDAAELSPGEYEELTARSSMLRNLT